MAKYVCDYGSVRSTAEKLASIASDLDQSATSYESNITQDLSKWNGAAKSSFESFAGEKISSSKASAAALKELATFIKAAADSIEATDDQLSSNNI